MSNAEDQVIVHNVKTAYQVIARVNGDIQLTDDEIRVVLFSSMDRDYFPNLLISQGNFTEWFTINFAGEGQEEIDFKLQIEGEWDAVTDLAKFILDRY